MNLDGVLENLAFRLIGKLIAVSVLPLFSVVTIYILIFYATPLQIRKNKKR